MQCEGQCNGVCIGRPSTYIGSHQHPAKVPIDDLLKSNAKLKIKDDVGISFNLTIQKGKGKEDDRKGKNSE